ncbi:DUF2093 domain-containing protein [Acuticoccus kandeliae]|uniref:DUF2093 domain-containing protein n=1 Tax=Acuticoccus kandeliae TaxID=2073160 RepID=UPI000D3E3C20|nr:DUF2093 domain-containing protein [Acuticoccus kandeliae]
MNRHEMAGRPGGEARLRYLDADFQVMSPGTFVRCAITGKPIPLAELRYWNVDTQEAYLDAAAAYTAFKAYEAQKKKG